MSNKICQLSTVHPVFDPRIYYKECATLAKNGFEVFLTIPEQSDYTCINGIKIRALPKFAGRIQRIIKGNYLAFKKVRETKAELVHFHDPELMIAGIFLKLTGIKVIYDVHEDVPKQILSKEWLGPLIVRKLISGIFNTIERLCSFSFDGIVTATEEIAQRFPVSKTIVVRNYPISEMITDSKEIDRPKDKVVIIYAGGLTKIRGIGELIEAIGEVNHNCELWLLGKFSSPEFEGYCKSLKGWERTKYFGMKPLEEVYPYIKAADIGVNVLYPLERYLVALPTKTFEFMAFSKPMIVNKSKLWKSLFKEAALYVECEKLEIAGAIDSLSVNKELRERMGSYGKTLFEENYSWESQGKKLVSFYHKVLS